MSREEPLRQRLIAGHVAVLATIAGLSEEDAAATGAHSGWTIKDTLAHLASAELGHCAVIRRLLAAESTPSARFRSGCLQRRRSGGTAGPLLCHHPGRIRGEPQRHPGFADPHRPGWLGQSRAASWRLRYHRRRRVPGDRHPRKAAPAGDEGLNWWPAAGRETILSSIVIESLDRLGYNPPTLFTPFSSLNPSGGHHVAHCFYSFADLAAGAGRVRAAAAPAAPAEAGPLNVFGAYATAIEEPWDGVIHAALNTAKEDGQIEYTYTDDIGYAGDMERVLREVAEKNKAGHHLRRRLRQRRSGAPRGQGLSRRSPSSSAPAAGRPSPTSRSSTTGSTSRPISAACWPAG